MSGAATPVAPVAAIERSTAGWRTPIGWASMSLGECVNLVAGFAFKSDRFSDNQSRGVALVKGENVSQGRILWSISKYWPEEEYADYERFHLRVGDVVVAMDRPWVPAGLKWAFIRENDPRALLVQRCALLRSKSAELDQDFLRFVVGGPDFENYVRPIVTGVNVPHISGAQILAHRFALPPIRAQRRIAAILSTYDDLIENCERRIRVLDEMARVLYREWFVLFRYPGHEKTSLVDSPLGRIPKGWQHRSVKDLAMVTYGHPFASASFSAEPVGLPVVRIRDILEGVSRTYTTESAGPRYLIKNGDILVGMDGDFHMCIWSSGPAAQNQRVARFEPLPTWATLHFYLALEPSIQILNKAIVGTTVAHLGDMHIKRTTALAPDGRVLALARNMFQPLGDEITGLRAECGVLRKTRDLLLPRLLSGQLSVEDAA